MQDNRQQQIDQLNSGGVERRWFKTEARAQTATDGKMVISGYGAIFNTYTNMGWYAEIVLPGFFDGIKQDRCACLFNHEETLVLGRIKNSTLTLKTDEKGLNYSSVLPSHRSDVYELVEGGYVYESSFSFTTAMATWKDVDRSLLEGLMSKEDLDYLSYQGKVTVRSLEKGKELFDVSPVTYAQYEGAEANIEIAKRSYQAWRAEQAAPEVKQKEDDSTDKTYEHRMRLVDALQRSNAH